MDLGEDDLALGAVLQPPGGDLALERAELDRLVAAGPALAQQAEQRRGLEGRVALELLDDPRPVLGEGVRPRPVGAAA